MAKCDICLLLCEDYKREAVAIIKTDNFPGVKIKTFPAFCGNSNTAIKDLSGLAPSAKNKCGPTVLLSRSCIKELKSPAKDSTEFCLPQNDQCFYMLANKKLVDKYMKEKSYILTPGAVSRLSSQIKNMKPEKEAAWEIADKSFSKLVLLDTGINKSAAKKLQKLSECLNIAYEIIPVGLDHFRMFLQEIIFEWQSGKEEKTGSKTALSTVESGLKERRAHKRLDIERICLVEINDSEMVRLKDISLGGIRLSSPGSLAPGSIHAVTIFPSIRKEIRLKGKVVWSSSKETPAGAYNHESGLKFLLTNRDSVRLLEQLLKSPKSLI